jgi:ABC-type spermidine/putrescine transport system permease subunit II
MATRAPRRVLRVYLYVLLVVLALPMVSLVALSFNKSKFGTLPFVFSTHWYSVLGGDTALITALVTSIKLATQVTVVTVIVGTLLALGLAKASIVVRLPVNGLLLALLTIPAVILSAGLVTVFDWLGLSQSTLALIIASIVTSLPFVVLIVNGRLQDLNPHYAEASRSLGASASRTFLVVTVPLIAPSIIAGGLLAFVICFNNFAIQLFLSPIGVSTLPVQIYSMVRLGVTPDVNALGSIIIVATVVLIIVLNLLTGSAARLFTSTNRGR